MNMQKLEYFISVADNLSFTKAAEKCFIAQTAMSRQIADLENELKVKLFKRDNRTVELTNEGKEFYWHAVHLLEIYREAVNQVNSLSIEKKYNLKIGIGPYENYLLAPYIADFNERFPRIELACIQSNYENLSSQFIKGTIDLMFCINHCAERARNCETIKICNDEWGVITSVNHSLAGKSPIYFADLNGETIVTMVEYNTEEYKNMFKTYSCEPERFLYVNNYASKLLFVQAGMGVAFVPDFVKKYLPNDIHYAIRPEDNSRYFVCAYHKDKRDPDFLSFVNYVKDIAPTINYL